MDINQIKDLGSTEVADNTLIQNLQQLLTEKARQSAENFTTEQIVEAALLQDSSVDDCAVLTRKTATSERELVAYVVSSRPFSPERLQSHLQSLLPTDVMPKAYVSVSTLPLTPTGEVDKQALTCIPTIDSDLMQRWEQRLQSLSEVEQIAVVGQEYTEIIPPLHLSELLADWKASKAIAVEDPATTSMQSVVVQESEPKALAISSGGPLWSEPDAPTTLTETLQRAAQKMLGNGIVYLQPDNTEIFQSYATLLEEAECVLSGLRKLGLKPQDQIIFQLEHTQDIISAFWGCILGGFTPIIMPIPPTYQESSSAVDKLCHVWQLLDKPLILTSNALSKSIQSLPQWLPTADFQLVAIEEVRANQRDTDHYPSQPDEVAFFTLTSGSTGMPKCIMLTHRNVLARAKGAIQLCQQSSRDIALNWLPFDHIGSISDWHIRCVYLGCKIIYVAKEYVIARVLNWLDLINKYRVSHSWAPNFAYSLINDALKQEHKHPWDLSCVKALITAGESVSAKVIEEYHKSLAIYGLKETAIQPAYGMAEFGSGITYYQATPENYQKSHTVDRLSLSGNIVYVSPEHPNSVTFTSLGPVIPGVTIRIVNSENTLLPEETVGRLQVKGNAVFPGYYKAPEVNKQVLLEDGWFDTGDLGFISQNCLVITGRVKEIIIINGANYYNGEIEAVVEEIEGVEASYTAACGVRDFSSDSEQLAIFFSSLVCEDNSLTELLAKIQEQVVRKVRVKPTYIIPVERETIPKTPIGKIQRSQLVRRFEAGEFDTIIKQVDILRGNANTLPDWFYRKRWRPKTTVSSVTKPTTGQSLVFLDRLGLGALLCQELSRLKTPWIRIEEGSDFAKLSDNHYCIDAKNPDHYRQLLESVSANNEPITQVLHLWTYDKYGGEISSPQMLEQSQEVGTYSLLFLSQALAQCNAEHAVRLYVIGSHTQPTSPSDEIACEKTPTLGLIKTISQEMPWLDCRHIDIATDQAEVNAKQILQELQTVGKEREVAYRNGQRLVARLEKVDFRQEHKQELPFKHRGMYLLSGGLGGIGVEIAKYLLEHYQARLLLVGRTPLPERSVWQSYLEQQIEDTVSQRIKAYESLEQLEGEIIYEAVDICNQAQLEQVVEQAKSSWQCDLDGVIHLAGIFQERLLVEETRDSLVATLRPKVLGTWVLSQLLKHNPNSLFISFSSLSSFFAGATMGAYAAANSFLDCFNHYQRNQCSMQSYCFAWPTWDEIGISRGYQMQELLRLRGYYTLTAKQGLQSLLVGVQHNQAQLLVGLDESSRNIRRYIETKLYCTQTIAAYFTASTSQIPLTQLKALSVQDRFGQPSTCRFRQLAEMPLTDTGEIDRQQLVAMGEQVSTKRIAPKSELEHQLVKIWQEVLSVPQVGLSDNFFELGGTSLLAVQLFAQIDQVFGKNLPLASLFQAPTVEQQAALLQEDKASWSSLVAIQPNGSKPPFFCLHALGGNVIFYRDLANHLDPEQPVYGLQAQGLDGEQSPYTQFEDLAAHYIQEICTLQPKGPYFLGGYSLGGLLAFEVARQLVAKGQEVGMLALFDTVSPKMVVDSISLREIISIHLSNLAQLTAKEKIAYVLLRIKGHINELFRKFNHKYQQKQDSLPEDVLDTEVVRANFQALSNYVAQVYPGRITLFRTREQCPKQFHNLLLGWGELAGQGVEVHEVRGPHEALMREPYVRLVAEKLQACLDRLVV